MTHLLSVNDVSKTYKTSIGMVNVLDRINFFLKEGEFVIIFGPSGVGKSTFLNIIGTFEKPSSGKILYKNLDMYSLSDSQISSIRNKEIGFVFQSFNLINRMTVKENIELPAILYNIKEEERTQRVKALLFNLGLEKKIDNKPFELSGGEQQRVAIARALINKPSMVLADEPTGNLDTEISMDVCNILRETTKENSTSVIMVTHNKELLSFADRIIYMNNCYKNINEYENYSDKKIKK